MKIMKLITLVYLCIVGVSAQAQLSNGAQTLPETLIVTKENNIIENERREIKASKTIRFEPGFSSRGYLHAFVVSPGKPSLETQQQDSKIILYPNPSLGSVTVMGNFNESVLVVVDGAGNQVFDVLLKGENPTIDLSSLKHQQEYILKVQQFTTRLILK